MLKTRPVVLGPESSTSRGSSSGGARAHAAACCPLCSQSRASCQLPADVPGAGPSLETSDPGACTSPKRAGRSDSSLACDYLQDADHITGNSCKASEWPDNSGPRGLFSLTSCSPGCRPYTAEPRTLPGTGGEASGTHLPLELIVASGPHSLILIQGGSYVRGSWLHTWRAMEGAPS